MGQIKLQESELEKLASDTEAKRQELATIRNAMKRATEDTDWTSEAANNFKATWADRERVLNELDRVLDEWQQACTKHKDVAANVNQRFSNA